MDKTTVSFQASVNPDSLSRALKQISNKNFKLRFDIDSAGMERFTTDLQRLVKADDLQTWLKQNSKAAKLFGSEIQHMVEQLRSVDDMTLPQFQKLEAQFGSIQAQALALGKTGLTFSDTLKQGFSSLFSPGAVLSQGLKALRGMTTQVTSLEAAQARLAQASGIQAQKLAFVTEQAFALGETLGKTGVQILDTVSAFQQAGFPLADSLAMAESVSLLSNLSGGLLDTSQAAGLLLSVLQDFQMSGADSLTVADKLAAVSTRSGVGFSLLAQGLEQVSGVLGQSGTTLDQTLGLLAGGYARLGNMEQAAEGLLLIQQRLLDLDAVGEPGDGLSSQLQKAFGEIGVSVTRADGGLRSLYDIVTDYGAVFPSLTAEQKQFFGELAAGTEQLSVWNALTEQISAVEQAAAQSRNSLGSASAENQKYLSSITGKASEFDAAFQRLSQTLLSSELITFFMDLGTAGVKAMDSLVSAITPLGALGAVVGGLFGGSKNSLDYPKKIQRISCKVQVSPTAMTNQS